MHRGDRIRKLLLHQPPMVITWVRILLQLCVELAGNMFVKIVHGSPDPCILSTSV
jgi:hypothetical protein